MPPKGKEIHDVFFVDGAARATKTDTTPRQAVKWCRVGEPVHPLPNSTQNKNDRSEFLAQGEYTLHFAFTVTIAPSTGHFHAIIII